LANWDTNSVKIMDDMLCWCFIDQHRNNSFSNSLK
jgi:hypothetical protein